MDSFNAIIVGALRSCLLRLTQAVLVESPENPLLLAGLGHLASEIGLFDEAMSFYLQCEEIQQQAEADHCARASTKVHMGLLLDRHDKHQEAREMMSAALQIIAQRSDADNLIVSNILERCSMISLNDSEMALELMLRCLRIRQKILGPDHHETAKTKVALANLLGGMNRREEALQMHQEAMQALVLTYSVALVRK